MKLTGPTSAFLMNPADVVGVVVCCGSISCGSVASVSPGIPSIFLADGRCVVVLCECFLPGYEGPGASLVLGGGASIFLSRNPSVTPPMRNFFYDCPKAPPPYVSRAPLFLSASVCQKTELPNRHLLLHRRLQTRIL